MTRPAPLFARRVQTDTTVLTSVVGEIGRLSPVLALLSALHQKSSVGAQKHFHSLMINIQRNKAEREKELPPSPLLIHWDHSENGSFVLHVTQHSDTVTHYDTFLLNYRYVPDHSLLWNSSDYRTNNVR